MHLCMFIFMSQKALNFCLEMFPVIEITVLVTSKNEKTSNANLGFMYFEIIHLHQPCFAILYVCVYSVF